MEESVSKKPFIMKAGNVFVPKTFINLDEFIIDLLKHIPDIPIFDMTGKKIEGCKGYYIKGGKAFNHYYKPEIESADYDLIALEEVKDYIFSQIISNTTKKDLTFNKQFYSKPIITTSNIKKYRDKDIRGKIVTNRVQSIYIEMGNEQITIMDIIMPESIESIINETENPTDELRYMNKELFDMDLTQTFEDRNKKLKNIRKNMKDTIENSKKRESLELKVRKSKERYLSYLSSMNKGIKLKKKLSKKKSLKKKLSKKKLLKKKN
jgi:hypothetical protein